MAQDFANRSRSRKRKKTPAKRSRNDSPRFSVGSFAAGVVAGVGLFLLGAYLPEILSSRAAVPAADLATTTEPPGDTRQSVEFVFQDMLGNDSVTADPAVYPTRNPTSASATAELADATPGATQYLLQSGSFQVMADAERRRGELLLLDLPANVVEALLDDKIWYRVIVGPFDDRRSAQAAVTQLRERQIAAYWLQRPAP